MTNLTSPSCFAGIYAAMCDRGTHVMHFANLAEEGRDRLAGNSEFLPQPSCRPDGVALAAGLCNRSATIALKARHAYSEAKSAQCRRLE
jgi:hypothetical protein